MKITGMDSLLRKLNALGGDAENVVVKTTKEVTAFVKDEAKMNCPVGETGDLRQSITDEVREKVGHVVGTVGTGMEYAIYKELGTGPIGEASKPEAAVKLGASYAQQGWVYTPDEGETFYYTEGQPAHPYLYPALKDNEDQIKEKYKTDLQKEIRKVAKS